MATELKEKVSFLEESLNRFILTTNEIIYNMSKDTRILKDEMKDFKDEMKDFKDEMGDFKDEMKDFKDEMGEFKDEMKDFKDEMGEFKDEMKDFKDEMRMFKNEMGEFKDEMREFKKDSERDRRAMNKQWGELANRLGTFAEDFTVRRIRRDPANTKAIYEFDAIAVTDTQVFFDGV